MRLTIGEKIILLDNSGWEFETKIKELNKKMATAAIISKHQNKNEPERDVWLFQSLIKQDKFEWVLQKCTEIGVSHFVPIISERSEKKDLNFKRTNKIIKEAAEQSERGKLPTLQPVLKLEDFSPVNGQMLLIAFDPSGLLVHNSKFIIPDSENTKIGIFVGPEGGWTEKELSWFKSLNVQVFNLGPRILRAETAAIVAATKLLI